jgi:hypothetical protein
MVVVVTSRKEIARRHDRIDCPYRFFLSSTKKKKRKEKKRKEKKRKEKKFATAAAV